MKLTFDSQQSENSESWCKIKSLLDSIESEERASFLQEVANEYGHGFIVMQRLEPAIGESNDSRGKQFRFPIMLYDFKNPKPRTITIDRFIDREPGLPNVSNTSPKWCREDLREVGKAFLRVMKRRTLIDGVCILGREKIYL